MPGTSGAKDTDVIQVEVKPQLVARTAAASPKHGGAMVEDAVYCSCRCANAEGSMDDGASYCDCPSGYECTKLIDDLGLGSSELAGSYCIENGTADSLGVDWGVCSSVAANCGNGGKNP